MWFLQVGNMQNSQNIKLITINAADQMLTDKSH